MLQFFNILPVFKITFHNKFMILDIIYISIILFSLIIGLIFTKKSSQFSYKLLLIFLTVTFLNESVCFYIKTKQLGSTYIFYNFYYYMRFPILGYMFLLFFENRFHIILVYLFWLLSAGLGYYNFFYLYGLNRLHSNYLLAGGIFTIILCLTHFYNILKKSRRENPITAPFFGVAVGLFFFFLGMLPFFGIINLLLKKDIIFVSEYLVLIKALSIFLYSLIGLDFFIQWKQLKSEH